MVKHGSEPLRRDFDIVIEQRSEVRAAFSPRQGSSGRPRRCRELPHRHHRQSRGMLRDDRRAWSSSAPHADAGCARHEVAAQQGFQAAAEMLGRFKVGMMMSMVAMIRRVRRRGGRCSRHRGGCWKAARDAAEIEMRLSECSRRRRDGGAATLKNPPQVRRRRFPGRSSAGGCHSRRGIGITVGLARRSPAVRGYASSHGRAEIFLVARLRARHASA